MMSNVSMNPGRLYLGPPELGLELGEVTEATLEYPHTEPPIGGDTHPHTLVVNEPAELSFELKLLNTDRVLAALLHPKLMLRWAKLYRPEWLAIGARTKKLRTRRKYADKIFRGYMAWARGVICQWVS